MRSQIGNAIVFCSLPPLLKQGQTGTRVVRPKWAIEWLRVGDAMVVGHALALVAVAPQRDQVGPPIDKVRPFGHHAIADRKSTRLNSSHSQISYAVFCLKK